MALASSVLYTRAHAAVHCLCVGCLFERISTMSLAIFHSAHPAVHLQLCWTLRVCAQESLHTLPIRSLACFSLCACSSAGSKPVFLVRGVSALAFSGGFIFPFIQLQTCMLLCLQLCWVCAYTWKTGSL